ncbi:hypothetical protein [Nocardioides sp. NPDC006303]|uniref:hypothetical protein n=1 Tax=Nocardioides sp. NPDC006303 TaxID=3156747 RepID=UPI0033B38812
MSSNPGTVGSRRTTLKKFLTERSGFYIAEAVGLVVAKLAILVLAGLCVWILAIMAEEGGPAVFIAGPFILVPMALSAWIGLFGFNQLIAEVLRPANRFRRLPRIGVRRGADRFRAARPDDSSEGPDDALRSSPRGQANLLWRTGLFLLLGMPSAYLVGYFALAYLNRLWIWWTNPIAGWDWSAPENFGAFGAWFSDLDHLGAQLLVPTISFMFLTMGTALAALAVPLLTRRGADAIDLAVTEAGVITRGGLRIGWDEITEVLVVRDTRITAWVGSREFRAPGQSSQVVNPTYVAEHSRTRVALALHDLTEVFARCTASQRRALWADHTFTYGYALCDLWIHSEDLVSTNLAPLRTGARKNRIPVTDLKRGVRGFPDGTPRWFSAWVTRR